MKKTGLEELDLENIARGVNTPIQEILIDTQNISDDYKRFCFICNSKLVDSVKALAKSEGFSIREIMEQMIINGLNSYQEKTGKKIQVANKKASDIL